MDEAKRCGVHTFAAPPLARALYFTTRVDQSIPEALYFATAQVIAYVFNLEAYQPRGGRPKAPRVEVPPDMRFNADGTRETGEAYA